MKKTIEQKLENRDFIVGLSKYDQKLLNDYNIRLGNIFETKILGKILNLQRNTMGLRIVNINHFSTMTSNLELPFRGTPIVSKVSLKFHHQGHSHEKLPIEWFLNNKTKQKISAKIMSGDSFPMVGLNSYESKTLTEYGVKVGNTFKINIHGYTFSVKRLSAGIEIGHRKGIQMAFLKSKRVI